MRAARFSALRAPARRCRQQLDVAARSVRSPVRSLSVRPPRRTARSTGRRVSMSLSPRPERLTNDQPVLAQFPAEIQSAGQRVRALDRRDDALGARTAAAAPAWPRRRSPRGTRRGRTVLEIGVLRADARVVQARGDRVRLGDLALLVLEDVASASRAGCPGSPRSAWPRAHRTRCRARRARRPTRRTSVVGQEGVEEPDGVGPAADAGGDRVRQPSGPLQDLAAGLDADHAVEVADHGCGKGCGPATVPKR